MKFIVLCFFLCTTNALAKLVALDQLPLDFQYVVESYQHSLEKQKDQKLRSLDHFFSSLKKNQLFFFIKSEMLKSILEFPYEAKGSLDAITLAQIEQANKKLAIHKGQYSNFSQWLIRQLKADVEKILQDPQFDQDAKFPLAAKQLKAKLKLLGPLFWAILQLEAMEFNQLTEQIAQSIVKNLLQALQFYFAHSAAKLENATKLSYFVDDHLPLSENKKAPAPAPTTNQDPALRARDEALKSLGPLGITPTPSITPTPPVWTPAAAPPGIPTPDPHYTPGPLPTPVNDWAPK